MKIKMKNLWWLNSSGDVHAANMQVACVDRSHQYAGAATNIGFRKILQDNHRKLSMLLVSQIQYDNVIRWSSVVMRV